MEALLRRLRRHRTLWLLGLASCSVVVWRALQRFRIRSPHHRLLLNTHYDYIVVGAGAAGCVVRSLCGEDRASIAIDCLDLTWIRLRLACLRTLRSASSFWKQAVRQTSSRSRPLWAPVRCTTCRRSKSSSIGSTVRTMVRGASHTMGK